MAFFFHYTQTACRKNSIVNGLVKKGLTPQLLAVHYFCATSSHTSHTQSVSILEAVGLHISKLGKFERYFRQNSQCVRAARYAVVRRDAARRRRRCLQEKLYC